MAEEYEGRRESRAKIPDLVDDPVEKAQLEARNGLRQYDQTIALIDTYLDEERPFRLRASMILTLHRAALDGISHYAGTFRPDVVEIEESKHSPPAAFQVAALVEELCDYINENWEKRTAIHLAAYAMWRLNWIHPFVDGNGRTSRCISYLVFCVRAGMRLPGSNTIPEQIERDRAPYFDALEAADEAYSNDNKIDVTEMESLLDSLFANQLVDAYRAATGHDISEGDLA